MNNDKLPTICNDWLRTRDNWRLNLQTVTKYQRSDCYIYFSLVGLPNVSVFCDSSEAADDLLAMLDKHFSTTPTPVDDRALAEALKQLAQLRYNSITVDVCAIDTVLAALRAARHKAENSTVVFKEATAARERDFEIGQRGLLDRAIAAEAKLEATQQEVECLREWKRQQLEVESSWDTQALGKLLGVPLGKPIRPAIAPGIEALQTEAKELQRRVAVLEAAIKHERIALIMYRDRQSGKASHKDITMGIELLDAALKPRVAGKEKAAT